MLRFPLQFLGSHPYSWVKRVHYHPTPSSPVSLFFLAPLPYTSMILFQPRFQARSLFFTPIVATFYCRTLERTWTNSRVSDRVWNGLDFVTFSGDPLECRLLTRFLTQFVTCSKLAGADLEEGCRGWASLPHRWSILVFAFKICLPHQSVTPFLSGAPLLRKILDPPLTWLTPFDSVPNLISSSLKLFMTLSQMISSLWIGELFMT